jgi:hypothetical protein
MALFERRISTRQLQHGHAMFVSANKAFLVEIKDISKGGCQILRPRGWPFNLQDDGQVYIFGEAGPVPTYKAHIAWFREEFIGLEFN